MIGQVVQPSKSYAFFSRELVSFYRKINTSGHLGTKRLSVCITKILTEILGSEQTLYFVENQKREKLITPKFLYELSPFSFYSEKDVNLFSRT